MKTLHPPAPPNMAEPLTVPSSAISRFTLRFPPEHGDIFEFYETIKALHWDAGILNLAQDVQDWKTLSEGERHFFKTVLGFFASSDGLVNENLMTNFGEEVLWPEARLFYSLQQAQETVHQEVYALLIYQLISDPDEREALYNAAENTECIKRKSEWMLENFSREIPFARRLFAFALVEGVLFSASFCAIFWLRTRSKMPGLCESNEYIARDEALHATFAAHLYTKHVRNRLTQQDAEELVESAVQLEKAYVDEALSGGVIGISPKDMFTYVQYVADHMLQLLGYTKKYKVQNPFDFMSLQSVGGYANFFERRSSDYSIASAVGGPRKFATDEAF